LSVRGWITRHELVAFFALAYLLSWAVWPLMLLNPTSTPMVAFGPGLAALALAAVVAGRRGTSALVKQFGLWRVSPLWYVIAVLGPFVMTSLAAATVVATGAPSPDWGAYTDWPGLLATLVSTIVIVGVFEELGWRGFALPRMQRDHTALWAAIVLGAIWSLWHMPELVSNPTEREPAPFLIAVVAWSVLLAWIYNSTRGSLLLVVLFHAATNTSLKFLMPTFEARYHAVAWWAVAGVSVLAAVAVVVLAGARRLTMDLARRDRVSGGGPWEQGASLR
jgi:CAAX protease family protein